jgi:hypothetical protein
MKNEQQKIYNENTIGNLDIANSNSFSPGSGRGSEVFSVVGTCKSLIRCQHAGA